MRQTMSVSILITVAGVVWFLLALATTGPSGDWLVGLFIAGIGAAGWFYARHTAAYSARLREHMEMADAIRRGLHK